MDKTAQRFKFISHALNGDGPFRPAISYDTYGKTANATSSYIVRYPRESEQKHARRCEVAFYASPLARVTSRFTGYLSTREVMREINQPAMKAIAEDVDGKGNSLDVFWQQFMLDFKARGSMLLLVDSPKIQGANQAEQAQNRLYPFWTPIQPELVTAHELGDDGKFEFVEFSGRSKINDKWESVVYRFERDIWQIKDKDGSKILDDGEHGLGECPVLIATETTDYPSFGPFSVIADLAKRLYNMDSELDEILRAQTFSILTQQVPEDSSDEQKLSAAKVAGETIGVSNLLVHTGQQPAFIAPPDGPANVYMERIRDVRDQIREIGMDVADSNQSESGKAKQLRFQALNGELAKFSERMEDLERRAWDLTTKWLGMQTPPQITWPRDFNISDVLVELEILQEMRNTAMPDDVITAQSKKVVSVQFSGSDTEDMDKLLQSLESDRSAL